MISIKSYIQLIIIASLAFILVCGCVKYKKDGLTKVLILSGKNNHEWQKTTPLLVKIFEDSKLFTINVTEIPETLNYKELIKYDVVVSNWNSFPDNDYRMPEEQEQDFGRYVKDGGGAVFIHAGASSFYDWDEYHYIGIGRWGKETSHGKLTKGKIHEFNKTHPITKGLSDFYIIDEIWENTDIHPKSKSIASIIANDEENGHLIIEPAIFVTQFGKGRSFYTILGHNELALLNTGLQTILLRATQWVAHREVTIPFSASFKDENCTGTNDII